MRKLGNAISRKLKTAGVKKRSKLFKRTKTVNIPLDEKAIKKLRSMNANKPKMNLCKISWWLQFTIILFLDDKDMTTCGRVWKTLFDWVNEEYIWKHRFTLLKDINNFEDFYADYIKDYCPNSESCQNLFKGRNTLYRHMYASKNMYWPKYKPLNILLKEHKDKILCVSTSGNYLATGAKDNLVKLWNLKDKSN